MIRVAKDRRPERIQQLQKIPDASMGTLGEASSRTLGQSPRLKRGLILPSAGEGSDAPAGPNDNRRRCKPEYSGAPTAILVIRTRKKSERFHEIAQILLEVFFDVSFHDSLSPLVGLSEEPGRNVYAGINEVRNLSTVQVKGFTNWDH